MCCEPLDPPSKSVHPNPPGRCGKFPFPNDLGICWDTLGICEPSTVGTTIGSMAAWYIYLHENHKNQLNVGKYAIHGSYGVGEKNRTNFSKRWVPDPVTNEVISYPFQNVILNGQLG